MVALLLLVLFFPSSLPSQAVSSSQAGTSSEKPSSRATFQFQQCSAAQRSDRVKRAGQPLRSSLLFSSHTTELAYQTKIQKERKKKQSTLPALLI